MKSVQISSLLFIVDINMSDPVSREYIIYLRSDISALLNNALFRNLFPFFFPSFISICACDTSTRIVNRKNVDLLYVRTIPSYIEYRKSHVTNYQD